MPNRVYLHNEGYIANYYQGNQSHRSVVEMGAQTKVLAGRQRAAGRPVWILVELADIGSVDVGARMAGIKVVIDVDLDKVALLKASPYLVQVARFVVTAAGKNDKIKFFQERSEAIEWFNQPNDSTPNSTEHIEAGRDTG